MSVAAKRLLADFDALSEAEREAVVAELLARHPIGAGELSDTALVEVADELFCGYDAEEGDGATPAG